MDIRQALIDFFVVAIPGVALYFTGWAYLSAYLDIFGVNISELTLDTPTIFIYSYSPINAFLRAFPVAVGIITVGLLMTLGLAFFLGRKVAIPVSAKRIWKFGVTKWLSFLVGAVLVIQFVIVPLVNWGAQRAANLVWQGQATSIEVITNQDHLHSRWIENYRKCAERRALYLVFADDGRYFSLCKSDLDPESGLVFQFRGEGSLVSVRPVRRPE